MMEHLPIELVLEIFEQLSERELCLVSLVSSQWYQWTLIPSLWKAFFVRCHPYAAKQDVIWPILSDQEFREFIQRRMVCMLRDRILYVIIIAHAQHNSAESSVASSHEVGTCYSFAWPSPSVSHILYLPHSTHLGFVGPLPSQRSVFMQLVDLRFLGFVKCLPMKRVQLQGFARVWVVFHFSPLSLWRSSG
mgnify:CR=1 FL=1